MSGNNLIYLHSEEDRLNIYMHNEKGNADNFMKYCLRHFKDDYRDGGTYQNQDVWRFYELYSHTKKGEGFESDFPYAIFNGGEWECAIKIDGTPDFHGGLHGYEHAKSVFAKADGKDIELEKNYSLWASELEFVQLSEIYRQGTRDEVMATHVKHYIFKDGKVNLHQEIVWKQDVNIILAYTTMMPIRRTSDDTPTGEQISDSFMINDETTVYDVSKENHDTGMSGLVDHKRDVKYVKIWGETSGVCGEVSVSGTIFESNHFLVQKTKEYNKVYFSIAGDGVGHEFKEGNKWEIDTLYEIYRR